MSQKVKNEIYYGHPDGFVREKLNCPFYPGCYIAGDCSLDDWKNGNCGLPAAEKQRRRDKWMQDLELSIKRRKLSDKLKSYVMSGRLDELLEDE